MTCKNRGIKGKVYNISQPSIVKGSDGFVVSQVVYEGDEGAPYKIEGFVGATGFLANEDGTTLSVEASLESEDLGLVLVPLSSAQTALLKASEEASLEILLEDSSGVKIIQFDGSISVKNRLF